MSLEKTRHASRMGGISSSLCGELTGRMSRPKESVNCPDCRTILNHVRQQYPQHANYTDWRLTAEQRQQAARDFVADMHGGAND
jgi:hypothetical protein